MTMEKERPLDSPEPEARISTACECCGDNIYEGEECYHIDDNWYCTDCVRFGLTTAPYLGD